MHFELLSNFASGYLCFNSVNHCLLNPDEVHRTTVSKREHSGTLPLCSCRMRLQSHEHVSAGRRLPCCSNQPLLRLSNLHSMWGCFSGAFRQRTAFRAQCSTGGSTELEGLSALGLLQVCFCESGSKQTWV